MVHDHSFTVPYFIETILIMFEKYHICFSLIQYSTIRSHRMSRVGTCNSFFFWLLRLQNTADRIISHRGDIILCYDLGMMLHLIHEYCSSGYTYTHKRCIFACTDAQQHNNNNIRFS